MSYRGSIFFVCLLLVSACLCFQARRGETAQRPLAKAAALHGEAAVRQLKTDGGYASLAAAMAAARYQINAAPASARAACSCTRAWRRRAIRSTPRPPNQPRRFMPTIRGSNYALPSRPMKWN